MEYKSSPVGNEISCVIYNLNKGILNNVDKLEKILLNALKKDKFEILKKTSYKFHPQGLTILVLLGESHASIHTYPEYNSLAFQLYSCRGEKDGRKTYEAIKRKLNSKIVDFKETPVVIDFSKNPLFDKKLY